MLLCCSGQHHFELNIVHVKIKECNAASSCTHVSWQTSLPFPYMCLHNTARLSHERLSNEFITSVNSLMKLTYRDVNDTWAPRSITNWNINGEGYHREVTTTWVVTQTNVNINKHWKYYKLIFSFWSYPSNVGGRVVKTIGLCSPFTKSLPLHMHYYAAVVSESSPAAWWHRGNSRRGWWKVFGKSANA